MERNRKMDYISGKMIRELREMQGLTQKQLGEQIGVCEKAVSKWETGKGLPDISLLEPLAMQLKVSVAELMNGQYYENKNRAANMKKSCFYVCPLCGNVIHSLGEGAYSCCGIMLPKAEGEEADTEHEIRVEKVDNEYYVTIDHPMNKEHFLSFIAYVTSDRIQMSKLYPEQEASVRFRMCGHGEMYVYCNRHGAYRKRI